MSTDPFNDEFWPIYPRKVAKAKAKRMWAKQIKAGHKPETIIAGLKRLLPELKARRPEFQPHPASWLNDERWDDEPMLAPHGSQQITNPRMAAAKRVYERHMNNGSLNERVMEVDIHEPKSRAQKFLDMNLEPVRRPKGQPSAIQMILAQRAKENN
ncbi:hypothetical protein [Ahrensia sp. 13_GOM-1096m]|uniref:hypothetical protein n=1 Tax=Ahrensia sp. 13_GOM-1096m TaxID=1380380 RepID=UPI000479088F|nr:hypothetical protein [Ahrensia sp. 13_GOM-1096m]